MAIPNSLGAPASMGQPAPAVLGKLAERCILSDNVPPTSGCIRAGKQGGQGHPQS